MPKASAAKAAPHNSQSPMARMSNVSSAPRDSPARRAGRPTLTNAQLTASISQRGCTRKIKTGESPTAMSQGVHAPKTSVKRPQLPVLAK